MRDSNMPVSRGDFAIDGTLGTLNVLDPAATEDSDDLLSGLVIDELDFWWGAPLPVNGMVKSCICTSDPLASAALATAGELA